MRTFTFHREILQCSLAYSHPRIKRIQNKIDLVPINGVFVGPILNEHSYQKTNNLSFRPGPTQTKMARDGQLKFEF